MRMFALLVVLASAVVLAACRDTGTGRNDQTLAEVQPAAVQDPLPMPNEAELEIAQQPQFLYGNARSSLFPDALLLNMLPREDRRCQRSEPMYGVARLDELDSPPEFSSLPELEQAFRTDDYVCLGRVQLELDSPEGWLVFSVVSYAANPWVELSWGEKYRKVSYGSMIAVFNGQGQITCLTSCDRLLAMRNEGGMLYLNAFTPAHQWFSIDSDGQLRMEVTIFCGLTGDEAHSMQSEVLLAHTEERCRYFVVPAGWYNNLEIRYRGEYLFNQDCRTPDGLAPEDLREGYLIYRFGNDHVWPFSYVREMDALAVLSSGDEIPGSSGLINLGGLD